MYGYICTSLHVRDSKTLLEIHGGMQNRTVLFHQVLRVL